MGLFDKFWRTAVSPAAFAISNKTIREGFDYVFRGKRPSDFPEEGPSGDIQARAKASDSPESARDLIDEIIGSGPSDTILSRRIDGLFSIGRTLSKIDVMVQEREGSLTPFSPSGDALLATGGAAALGRSIVPYQFVESRLDALFKDDPRAQLLYLREFDPESLLPVLVEQDTDKIGGGKKWYSYITDTAGRIIGSPWEAMKYLGRASDRIEEIAGWYYYNDIPDVNLRLQMSSKFYDYQLNPWDFTLRHETAAREESANIINENLTGEQASERFEKFLKEQDLGLAGASADLFGKVLYDPINLIPATWIGKVASVGTKLTAIPIVGKAALKAESVGRLSRLFGPRGRSLLPTFTTEQIFKMDEVVYARHIAQTPPRGVLRALFEFDPSRLADEGRRRVLFKTSTKADELFNIADRQPLADFATSLEEGKVVGWMKDALPDFFDDPIIARVSGEVAGRKAIGKALEDFITSPNIQGLDQIPDEIWLKHAKSMGLETAEQVKQKHYSTLLQDTIGRSMHDAVLASQEALVKSSVAGQFIVGKLNPYVAAMRQVISLFTLNNPGFVFLNVVNNFAQYMWSAGRNPIRATNIAARSLWLETGSSFPGGGAYPQYFQNILKKTGFTALNTEDFVTRSSSLHDILGKPGLRALDDFTPEEVVEKLTQQAVQPVKSIFAKGRFKDRLLNMVYVASRVDQAFRRSTFLNSIASQQAYGTSPSWIAKTLIPDIHAQFRKVGRTEDEARRAEGILVDTIKRWFNDDLQLQANETIEQGLTRILNNSIKEIEKGSLSGTISAVDLADQFLIGKGFTDARGRQLLLKDLHAPISEVSDLLSKTNLDDLSRLKDQLQVIPQPYFNEHYMVTRLNNVPNIERPMKSRLARLSVSNEVLKDDLADSSLLLSRHLQGLYKGLQGWTKPIKTPLGRMSPAQYYSKTVDEAVIKQAQKLSEITTLYEDAVRQGLKEPTGVGKIWNDYFKLKTQLTNQKRDAALFLAKRRKTAEKGVIETIDKWHKDMVVTDSLHRKALKEALETGDWDRYDNVIRNAYESSRRRRAEEIFGIPANERPKMEDFRDGTGPIANMVQEYVDFVDNALIKRMPDLKAGKLKIQMGESTRSILKNSVTDIVDNYQAWNTQVLGQSFAQTDFVMLNYNNQFGFDRGFQVFMPFFFWPSRTAINWGLRAARSPQAFGALTQILLQPQKYAEKYGLPQRLQFQIPVPIPFMDEFLNKIPVFGDLLNDADFGPVFWIDPMRYIFPYTEFRPQFEDEKRRGTPLGLTLDWFENNSPMGLNPFIKVVGRSTGLLDRDAWSAVNFGGGPFGLPVTTTARAAAAWLYTGDDGAIPASEQDLYSDKGFFSIPFLGEIIGLNPDQFDIYRAERALWTLAATDKLLPGKTHEEQVRAGWEALDTHTGAAWRKAVKASQSENFLGRFTAYIGFPFGRISGMNQGEFLWYDLQGAFSDASKNGNLDKFFEKYPEFQLRNAVVKGLSDPQERQTRVETELYYQDLETFVDAPFQKAMDEIEQNIITLRNQTQTESVREQVSLLRTEQREIRDEQNERRDLLDKAYPNREEELSLLWPPLDRALRNTRTNWYDIRRGSDESEEEFQLRQGKFIEEFSDDGFTLLDYQDLYTEHLLTQISFNKQMGRAADSGDFDKLSQLRDMKEAKLESLHESAEGGLSKLLVEDYIESLRRTKTKQEQEFEAANELFDYWMSLVSGGSLLSRREKNAISDYFRSLPEIQIHYGTSSIDLQDLSFQQKLSLMRRREIWRTYYQIHDPELQLDYMHTISNELNQINFELGLPELTIMDVGGRPPEVRTGRSVLDHIYMKMASFRSQQLKEEQSDDVTDEDISKLERLMANSLEDPSPTDSSDLDFYSKLFGTP